ncbi:sulfotransferase family 2 domain-containing protein [Mameliella alba]|uniref:sulfotransferase family 2 domain-containing protein n=1 Tax=Mameliella alba TaxID=561184 RepID=UPI0013FE1952|nr:sulfotransferase family 2 domain-containing protein [Mameliella alba]
MPIFRVNGKNIYFAHVPKCGGTTLEHNLLCLGVRVSFLDVEYYNLGRDRWSVTSPQHISRRYLDRYFHDGFFDYGFTVLRDPVERFVSAFNFKRGSIGWFVGFDRFLSSLERAVARNGCFPQGLHDNHFLPANELVPEGAEVFYLRDGLLAVFRALEARLELAPIEAIATQNAGKYADFGAKSRLHKLVKDLTVKPSPRVKDLTPDQVARIRSLYAADYARFFDTQAITLKAAASA